MINLGSELGPNTFAISQCIELSLWGPQEPEFCHFIKSEGFVFQERKCKHGISLTKINAPRRKHLAKAPWQA